MKQLSKEQMSKVEGGCNPQAVGEAVATAAGYGSSAVSGFLRLIFEPC